MSGVPLVLLIATLAAAVAATVIAALSLRLRRTPGVTAFSAMMFAGAFWCAAYAAELLAPSQSGKELWGRIAYVGIVVVSPSWLLFCLGYTGKLRSGRRRAWMLLYIVPAITAVLALSGDSAGLIWSSTELQTVHGMDVLVAAHGPWFWLHTTYSYACLLTGSLALLTTVLTRVKPLTGQGIAIVTAVALPWLANAVTLFYAEPLAGLDITPPTIVLSGAIVGLSLRRYGALRVFPGLVTTARDAIVDSMRDGVLVVSPDGVILSANRSAAAFLGVAEGGLLGRRVDTYFPELSWETFRHDGTALADLTFESSLPDADGHPCVAEIAVSTLGTDGASAGVIMAMRDVTERRQLEGELKHRALHDDLTGLPNRVLLGEEIGEAVSAQALRRGRTALLMLDLDRFKEINDTFGHDVGDRVLVTVGKRLRHAVRRTDLVARLGGDEFAVVLRGCSPSRATEIAANLRTRVTCPMGVQGRRLSVAVSVGIAIAPGDGDDVSTLLRHADVALYAAKGSTRGVSLYDAEHDPNNPERLEFATDLHAAIERRSLALYYQPLASLSDGHVTRVEALARWPRREHTVLGAGEFIPVAERCGWLGELTAWALDEALRQCRAWHDAGWLTDVSVNLSAADLRDPGLLERVSAALAKWRVDPGHLWLEITETSVMVDPDYARAHLQRLKDLGTRISIDDFGAGHSSLAYVRTLPAAELKIDRSFVRTVASQPQDRAIVRAAVALGHDLGLIVTAEGAEDELAIREVGELGCDCVQGYGLAVPMPADDVLGWVRRRTAGGAENAAGAQKEEDGAGKGARAAEQPVSRALTS